MTDKDYLTFGFRDGSVQVDYKIGSRNNLLLALSVIEGLASKECGLHVDDIRAIVDEEKKKLEAKPLVDIDEEN